MTLCSCLRASRWLGRSTRPTTRSLQPCWLSRLLASARLKGLQHRRRSDHSRLIKQDYPCTVVGDCLYFLCISYFGSHTVMLMVLQHGIKIYHWYWILPDMSH